MKRHLIILGFVLLTLAGCKRADLFHDLEEVEAEEILALLHQNGIEAAKEREVSGQDVSWKVTAKNEEVARARQILIANNVPRRKELGLSGVYKEKGLIPTPDEQKARFLLALKGEIINSLQKIPGVVDADVVLNVPQEGDFADLDPIKKRPTASVVVRTRNEALVAQTVTESKVQRFVANTVPNMDANDVAVIISRSDTGAPIVSPGRAQIAPMAGYPTPTAAPSEAAKEAGKEEGEEAAPVVMGGESSDVVEIAGLQISQESVGKFKAYFIGILSLLVAVSVFLLFNIMRLNRMRLKVQKGLPPTRNALGGGGDAGLLGDGGGAGAVEGTFDVGNPQRQQF